MPPVPLDSNLHHAHLRLAREQTAEHDRAVGAHLRDARGGHAAQADPHERRDRHAVAEGVGGDHASRVGRAVPGAGPRSAGITRRSGVPPGRLGTFFLVLLLLCTAPSTCDELPRLHGFPLRLLPRLNVAWQDRHACGVHAVDVAKITEKVLVRRLYIRSAPVCIGPIIITVVEEIDSCVVRRLELGGSPPSRGRASVVGGPARPRRRGAVHHLREAGGPLEAFAGTLQDTLTVLAVGIAALCLTGLTGLALSLLARVAVVRIVVLAGLIGAVSLLHLRRGTSQGCRAPRPRGLRGVATTLRREAHSGAAHELQVGPGGRRPSALERTDEADCLRQLLPGLLVLSLALREAYLVLRQVDVHGLRVHSDAAHVATRCVDQPVPLRERAQAVLPLRLRGPPVAQ
mmetsp:Transcript_89612/g.253997  ORF Transcript_89612/g.253997 Transcript_89612/m.253997 type:complete len:402 (-) Transcript_89612:1173-2378(-)